MEERYREIFSLPENQYAAGVPVLIAAGKLFFDTQTGKTFVQIRLQNIEKNDRTIVAAKGSLDIVDAFEGKKKQAFCYSALQVGRSQEFGQKTPIYLDVDNAKSFSVEIEEIAFSEGDKWSVPDSGIEWESLGQQRTLEDKYGKELAEQYQRDHGEAAKYDILLGKGITKCTCGAINYHDENRCRKCGKNTAELLKALDHNELSKRLSDYQRTQEKEKEQATKKAKQAVKRGIIAGALLIAVVVAISLISSAVKNNAYKGCIITESGFDFCYDGGFNLETSCFEDYDCHISFDEKGKFILSETMYAQQAQSELDILFIGEEAILPPMKLIGNKEIQWVKTTIGKWKIKDGNDEQCIIECFPQSATFEDGSKAEPQRKFSLTATIKNNIIEKITKNE